MATVFGGQWHSAAKQAEVVVCPDLHQRHAGTAANQVVLLPRPAGVEQTHQISAVDAGPGEDLEGVAGYPADPVEVAIEAGELEAFDQEGVEAGADSPGTGGCSV